MKNSIYPCLWFNNEAEAAVNFYCSVFKDSEIKLKSSLVVNFNLYGQRFMGLNGGPMFKKNPSISFFVLCESIEEINETWDKLKDGGSILMPIDKYPWSERYGWVQDRFGVSWQLYLGQMKDVGQKFTPSFMFVKEQSGKAEEAVNFYTSIFENSSINGISKYTAEDADVEGYVKHAQFKLNDQVFMAMDSSAEHEFSFNEGISIVVTCKTQEEIDYYWNKLLENGRESQCGWLEDKYGVSWQIVPAILDELMSDPTKFERVMQAVMKMKKLDIQTMIDA